MRTARFRHAAANLLDEVYVAGGATGHHPRKVINSVEKYDDRANQWQFLASMTKNRSELGLTGLNGVLYAFGGRDEHGHTLDSTEYYDDDRCRWRTMSANMTVPRRAFTAGKINFPVRLQCIYAIGGFNDDVSQPLASAEKWCRATGHWRTIAPMKRGRYYHAAASVKDDEADDASIFVCGGIGVHHDESSCERYDLNTNTWHDIAPMPESRVAFGMAAVPGHLIVVGGEDVNHQRMSSVLAYDIQANNWTKLANLPVATDDLGVGPILIY